MDNKRIFALLIFNFLYMIEINFWVVLVCAVLSLVVGSIWYGPLFGKKWMKIIGLDTSNVEKNKEMQKAMWPLYLLQFILSLMQIYILAYYVEIGSWLDISGICNSLLIWVAFIVPTLAGSAMWNNNTNKMKWEQFSIQAGYQLVMFVIFGFVLAIGQ